MKRKGVDEAVVGYVFAIFSVAVIVGSPFMGWVIQRFGRR
jgi:MFS family permease